MMDLTLFTFIMIATAIGINVFWFYKSKILRLLKFQRRSKSSESK